jgi:L-asparaginase
LILHTGGTLMMRPASSAPGATLEPAASARDLLAELPILARIADIESRVIFDMDSGDMQPADWITIARTVHDALSTSAWDGVVVVHGTDTMAYTASALALLLGPLPKPVVLTGSQRPLFEARSDARQNLVDAAYVATMPLYEVSIAFAARVLRGARATKKDAWALDAFESPSAAPLAELGVEVSIASHVRAAGPLAPLDARIEERVLAVRVAPGMHPNLLRGALRAGVRGLVLMTYGTGNLPHLAGSIIPAIEEARERDVPVLVVSQCPRGHVDMRRYAGGAQAEAAGAISGGDMTVEAAIAKLMIGLGRFGNGDALRAFLERDIVGERTPDTEPRAQS